MKNEPLPNRFRELSWRRKLSPAEAEELRAWLASHPDAQTDWDAEGGLNDALDHLPKVPVASNFTARVLQAVEREDRARQTLAFGKGARGWWLRWLPRAAGAGVVAGAVLLGVQHYRRAEDARNAFLISNLAVLPSPAALENFEVIDGLRAGPAPDEDLLKALQ